MVRHYIFDIDGTLINEEEILLKQVTSVAQWFTASPQVIITAFFMANQKAEDLRQKGQSDYKHNLVWYMDMMATELGVTLTQEECQAAAEAWKQAHQTAQNETRLYDDVLPLLQRLQTEGCQLHIASGANISNRKALLVQLGINHVFNHIFAAAEIGFQKQDKRFWESVMATLGGEPSQITVIGNQLNDDILHPHALGMKTILIERQTTLKKPFATVSVQPERTIKSFFEMIEYLNLAPPVCFVMQKVSPGTHMDYVFAMAQALRSEKKLPLRVLIEKPTLTTPTDSWVIHQRYTVGILRVLENVFTIARERFRGTKIFYIHYSFVSAISAGIITRLCGGTVYYWNAGMPWLYQRSVLEETYQRLAYKLIHHLVTGAEAIVPGYCTLYGLDSKRVTVIPNWIDLESVQRDEEVGAATRTSLGISATAPVILFVHKLAERKGAHHIISIFEQLKDDTSHLIVAGDGPLRSFLESQRDKSPKRARIHLLGQVPRRTVMELYQTATVFLMPSEEEGSPHSLIEAMAYQVPFIATAVGGVSETVPPETRTYLYQYGDSAGMAEGLDTLLHSEAERLRVITALKEWILQFAKPVAVDAFYTLLTTTRNTRNTN